VSACQGWSARRCKRSALAHLRAQLRGVHGGVVRSLNVAVLKQALGQLLVQGHASGVGGDGLLELGCCSRKVSILCKRAGLVLDAAGWR